MAESFINSFEELDLHMCEIIMNADGEDIMRDALSDHLFVESQGFLFMSRRKFGRCQDDGTIYVKEKGWEVVGRNESKFGKFAGSIAGSKINSMFAQSVNYLFRDPDKDKHIFTLLTTEKSFILIKNDENKDLIQDLFKLYKEHPVAPYQSYTTPGIDRAFIEHPLEKIKSWDIDDNFKFSEVVNFIFKLLNGTND